MKKKNIGILSIFVVLFVILVVTITSFVIGAEVFTALTEENNKIAEIKVDFPISDIREEQSLFGPTPNPTSNDIIRQIEIANKREDVKAIVLYIDSPGGEVIASREIYQAIKKSEKPIVSYMRKMGASGAYYIASGSDYIISEPETLTGSIGVMIGGIISFEEFFDNLGIDYNTISSGDKKGMGDIGKDMSEEEKEILQEIVNQIFDDFKNAVYENRKNNERFSLETFEEVSDGRIISGVLCGILVGFVQFVFLNDIFLILIAIGSSMGTMFGDLFGSFIKRRIGLERGKPSLILDQLMFIVFAIIFSYNYIIASQYLSILSIQSIFLILLITFFTHKFSNIIANKVGLKKVPW